jgi:hypothetical protein
LITIERKAEGSVLKVIHGTIVGSTIQLNEEPGLANGLRVEVVVRPIDPLVNPEHSLAAAFGGWADDPTGVDQYVREVYQSR